MKKAPERVVYRSNGMEISTNIPGFKWPTRDEKIDGLLSAGLIDQAEADRLRASRPTTNEGEIG
jgi:hypothetical protein